jgi:diguanylate cyclase (GGDEF)-like protein
MRLTTTSRAGGGGQSITIRRLSPMWASVAAIGALLLIFALDHATGSAPFQHLYYVPIIFTGVRFGKRGGATAAVAATVLYHLANPHLLTYRYEESDGVEIGLFLAAGVIAAQLADDAHRLHVLAMTDDLTGLHNLRSFEARLAPMVRDARESGTSFAMLVLDVDRLKSLNDKYGHLTGAEAVRTVGHILAARVPPEAVACRYGGDEFVVAIPHCTTPRANDIANDIRRAVIETAPVLAGIPFPATTLSVSIGVTSRSGERIGASGGGDLAGEAVFRAADAALYRAKARGRNHVCSVA